MCVLPIVIAASFVSFSHLPFRRTLLIDLLSRILISVNESYPDLEEAFIFDKFYHQASQ